ncbi:MAG: hypothetical protein KDJ49_06590 [Alphaproteobacteria bacterium]|nr:hypothetical protein [Alphaproteobacteria bacterium]USO08478.1 MAG: hypothetical protein H6866_04520 [Rhodospirillales bacterium]
MNQINDPDMHQDGHHGDELEDFDVYDEAPEEAAHGMDPGADSIDDADFHDVSDELDADVFGEGEPAPLPAKKTNWFNIGVVGAMVLVAGGLIASKVLPQIMAGNAPAPTVQEASGANTADSAAAAQEAIAPAGTQNAAQGAGLLDNPDNYAALGNTGNAPQTAANAQTAADDPFAKIVAQPTQGADDNAGAVPMPAPIATPQPGSVVGQFPNQPQTVSQTSVTPTQLPAPDTAQPQIQTAAAPALEDTGAGGASAGDTTALAGRVNAIETRLDQMDSKLTDAMDKIAAAAPADDSKLSAIQTTLERLETRIDDLSQSRPRAVAARSNDSDVMASAASAAPKKRSAASGSSKKTKPRATSTSSSVSSWDRPYSPARRAQPVSTGGNSSGGSGGWSLRGARPGHAVLARGGDMREVGVGDDVPGLGQVTGIASIGGRWVVQGTQGRLAQ